MSVLKKKWVIQNTDDTDVFEKILKNRVHLNLSEEQKLHDPYLFKDMVTSVDRIEKAIENNERIIIFGDYDVDGITGTAILVTILKRIGANVSYRLPNRVKDGYGLTEKYIHEFAEKEISLVITTDCGISCFNEVEIANKYGIDVIITDHHSVPEKEPNAFSILHPKHKETTYPFSELTGSGVAFKLAHALIIRFLSDEEDQLVSELADLASMGTVADLGPLIGENRTIVKMGIKSLANTRWVGLKKLMEIAKVKDISDIDTSTIGFQIGPRINAAGRIGDPYIALSLILQDQYSQKTDALARKLEDLNDERKELTFKAQMEVKNEIENYPYIPEIIIAENKDWHVGILGLIAGRLAESYTRPTLIMQDLGDKLVGSARSPEFFNVIDAITSCSELLTNFGGHAQAAGFTLPKKNLGAFKKELAKFAKKAMKDQDTRSTLNVDCELKKHEVHFDLIKKINELKPFGIGSKKPLFIIRNVIPQEIMKVGREKNHLKFHVWDGKEKVNVISFGTGEFAEELKSYGAIDIVCTLEENHWRNTVTIQFQALDFRRHV